MQERGTYCKTLPVHLPEADCSIFTLSVGRRRLSSRFVTINSTSIKPSMKFRNLTYMHHIIPSASYLSQCIISAPSVHHQSIMSASLVHHHCIIRASSGHQKHIISASSVHHQCIISASSVHHQCIISASSRHHQSI